MHSEQTAFDLALESECANHPTKLVVAHEAALNVNRLLYVRAAYLQGVFTDYPVRGIGVGWD